MNGSTVLVIEDDPIVADDIRGMVERFGAVVVGQVPSVRAAMVLTANVRPELALVDVRLQGGEDGIEAARQLRDQGVAVVFVTAHGDAATLRRAVETEPVGFLTKPVSEEELGRALVMGIRLAQLRRSAQAERQGLRELLHTIAEGVVVFDASGAVRYTNQAYLVLCPGYAPSELLVWHRRNETAAMGGAPPESYAPNLDVRVSASPDGTRVFVLRPLPPTPEEVVRVCANCRRVNMPDGHWIPMDSFITLRLGAMVSHGLCETCVPRFFD